ncbi:MAG: sulfite exporter TauE/SafE family protein [Planctomycetales bacterium]
MTLEWPLILMGGLLGSSHCLGMCGPLALSVGLAAPTLRSNLARQGWYTLGRLFTYAFLGALVGFAGWRLSQPGSSQTTAPGRLVHSHTDSDVLTQTDAHSDAPIDAHADPTTGKTDFSSSSSSSSSFSQPPSSTLSSTLLTRVAPSALAILAGALLVWQGLRAAGVFPGRKIRGGASGFCPSRGILATFLTGPGWMNAFLAGMLTGFLPCGLVYAYLALAASTGHMFPAAAVMALFGAGTAPLMILAGVGGAALHLSTRQHLLRAAAWCVVVTGLLTIHRGLAAARAPADEATCPFCSDM